MQPLEARLSKVVLALAALSSGLVLGQEASAPASTSSLEAARKDLQSLPSTARTADPTKDPALRFAMPSSPSANVREGNSSSSKTGEKEPSDSMAAPGDWLVDAWRKADLQVQARRAADANRTKALERTKEKGSAAAPNPFTPFMRQWISPRDQGLLQLKGPSDFKDPNAPMVELRDSSQNITENKSSSGAVTSSSHAEGARAGVGSLPPPNPYLPAAEGKNEGGPGPAAVASTSGSSRSAPLASDMTRLGPSGSSAISSPVQPRKPVIQTANPGFVPPTAPIIDERKYFPQLHRF